jgi:benzoyl-CoA reductase/2-hydroxyglutaryl-CoA dehydratase subunit BcrC/BadD/HgdB
VVSSPIKGVNGVKKIGITTTVPTEVLMAAGYAPVDLNNLFVGGRRREHLVEFAEKAGFPQNCCAWIKGIYGVCMEHGVDTVLCVTNGDCSNTVMLMEVLRIRGIEALPFAYPDRPDAELMRAALEDLAGRLGTTLAEAEEVRRGLEPARRLAMEVDDLTWREGVVNGLENHLCLVEASDFGGDVVDYERRQTGLIAEQYGNYTYPYSVLGRVADIKDQVRRRRIDGVIHYVQAFCHRGIGDIIFRDSIDLPVLTLEGNNDFVLNHHLRTRVEAFIDMLRRRAAAGGVRAESMT